MNEKKKALLIEAAQDALKDERHWSVVDVAERAESAKWLAEEILSLLGIPEDECPADCEDCKLHQENVE